MTLKFSQARRQAFLSALRVSGNQTLSAERAKVSRSWVQLHRSTDPEFDFACQAAIGDAERQAQETWARCRAGGERAFEQREADDLRPPAAWRFMDGAELVVRGTGGSPRAAGDAAVPPGRARPQIVRARVRQWSPRSEERFLSALAATCNVKAACAEVGLSVPSAYNHRRRSPAFARRWDEAIELGYTLVEYALIEAAGNIFSSTEPVVPAEAGPAGVAREMTADQAIHLLHMHKHQVHRIGKRPGQRPQLPDIEDVRANLSRKVDALNRHRRLKEERALRKERAGE